MAIRDINGYSRKTLDIGDWNMDATTTVTVSHGLSATEWVTTSILSVMIIDDATASMDALNQIASVTSGVIQGGYGIDSSTVNLARLTGGFFDDPGYDSTSFNRGFIVLEYIAD